MNFHKPFLQIITCGYILAQLLKQLSFPHKQRWKFFTSYFSAKPSTIIVENTENSPNSSSYTIEYKLVRKFSPIIPKIGIFSSVTAIVQHTKHKLLTHKLSKAAINCSYIYCEEIYGKVLQTRTFSLQSTLLWSLVLGNQLTFPHKTQNKQILHIA